MSALRYPRPPELDHLGNRHAVVEASAGTGKTFILEHLVIDLLLNHGARLEEILVVTFTERATAELSLRLRAKLSALCHLSVDDPAVQAAADQPDHTCWLIDEAARDRLRDALLAFDRATISTIHGFCRSILADHAFLHHRLFDEQAVEEKQAFHAAFVQSLRHDLAVDPHLQSYLRAWLVSGHTTADLETSLHACARELGRIFPARPEALQPGFDETTFTAAIATWPTEIDSEAGLLQRLKRVGVKGPTAKAVCKRVVQLGELAGEARRTGELAPFLAELQGLESDSWKSNGFAYLHEHLAKAAADPMLDELHRAVSAIEQARVPLLAALAHKFLPVVGARLQERKRAAGLFDFQDMLTLVAEHLAEGSATAPLLLSTLRQRYKYALIDEFQDTDDVQWSIFRRLFFESQDGQVLTVIGDPKQAIYRFRGADVHTYLRAREAILQPGGELVRLTQNYRSTAAVLDSTNALFDPGAGFFREGTGIAYDQPVTCGRPDRLLLSADGQPAPAVVVFDVQAADGTAAYVAEVKRALRRQMVEEIHRLLFQPQHALVIREGDDQREVKARDIFVLAFTNSECHELGEAMRSADLPFAFYKEDDLFQTAEAADILDLLRAVAEPEDRTLRARALLTEFFAFDLPDLAGSVQADTSAPWLRRLFEWHELAQSGDLGTLFAQMVARSGIVCREVCLRRSERSLTNTLHIFEILQEEATRAHASLREVAETMGAYVNRTRLPPGQDRDVQRLESDMQAVQIMTVHKSKGLEADVVFLYGGLGRGNRGPISVFHHRDGEQVVQVGALGSDESRLQASEISDEDRRVLYVALTRARARLYLPLYPQGHRERKGAYAEFEPILQQRMDDPATRPLYHRVPVACPAPPSVPMTQPESAALSTWQVPEVVATASAAEFHQIARERAGFFITSYTGVKRHHGGFVVAEDSAENSPSDAPAVGPTPIDPRELERGRLSGVFLHALLEQVPLDAEKDGPSEAWAAQPPIAGLLDRLARRHERDPRQLAHAARLVHTALYSSLRLGDDLVPGLGRMQPCLREVEFLYPIVEPSQPLLGSNLPDDGRPWAIERGLVKGFIDYLFEHQGRIYLCDWKGDWLPSWDKERLAVHCEKNYEVQARLYTLAVLRLAGLHEQADFEGRFGGVLYCFLRGMQPGEPEAGIYFRRPDWQTVLDWQQEMLGDAFWGLT
jgi:exodeoxyribonuclease V beta subunit